MIDDPFLTHGGALDDAVARYGGPRADWLDLSTGINPAPPALPALQGDVWTRLPERRAEVRMIAAARSAYAVPRSAGVAAAPGSQALISLLPFLHEPATVAVLAPTYSEHAKAFAAAGHDVCRFRTLDEIPSEARIVVVVNPNNPDGRRFAPSDLIALAERLAARNGLLVVDEAFVDPEPELSVASAAGMEGLVILRSFGKFFGLAGLRLGFALTTETLATQLAGRFGPWAISGPALAIGTALLEDSDLQRRTASGLACQSRSLCSIIAGHRLDVVGSTPMFTTVRHPGAQRLHEALCRRRILTRPFACPADWLRFGNPANEAEADRLRGAVGAGFAELQAGDG